MFTVKDEEASNLVGLVLITEGSFSINGIHNKIQIYLMFNSMMTILYFFFLLGKLLEGRICLDATKASASRASKDSYNISGTFSP